MNDLPRASMSALGHKRTFLVQNIMSALHLKADMCSALGDVGFLPKADIAPLLDQLVSEREKIIGEL
jgi:hypothetical protein